MHFCEAALWRGPLRKGQFYTNKWKLRVLCLCRASQLGAASGPGGTRVLCGSREQDNNVAASHCGDGAQLRTVAAPEEPVRGGPAAVQPALHLRRKEQHTHTRLHNIYPHYSLDLNWWFWKHGPISHHLYLVSINQCCFFFCFLFLEVKNRSSSISCHKSNVNAGSRSTIQQSSSVCWYRDTGNFSKHTHDVWRCRYVPFLNNKADT